MRKRRGKRGETKAIKLLEKHGYQIIQAQVTLPGYLYVDDDRLNFDIRPDYLVERDGVQYLAEVKISLRVLRDYRVGRNRTWFRAVLGQSLIRRRADMGKGEL